ncbi:hypothetical protein C8R45DRAFT_1104048 [Mycena sanguinolenta]|nr:hypothetical protein C8R45DRAFT_1104048 [Mycena sanguinolenta]
MPSTETSSFALGARFCETATYILEDGLRSVGFRTKSKNGYSAAQWRIRGLGSQWESTHDDLQKSVDTSVRWSGQSTELEVIREHARWGTIKTRPSVSCVTVYLDSGSCPSHVCAVLFSALPRGNPRHPLCLIYPTLRDYMLEIAVFARGLRTRCRRRTCPVAAIVYVTPTQEVSAKATSTPLLATA